MLLNNDYRRYFNVRKLIGYYFPNQHSNIGKKYIKDIDDVKDNIEAYVDNYPVKFRLLNKNIQKLMI